MAADESKTTTTDPNTFRFCADAELKKRSGGSSYVLEIDEETVNEAGAEPGETLRIGLFEPLEKGASMSTALDSKSTSSTKPVSEGDMIEVTPEDTGSQGDPLAEVEGFAVIIPHGTLGETQAVEITEVKDRFAFADVRARHGQSEQTRQ